MESDLLGASFIKTLIVVCLVCQVLPRVNRGGGGGCAGGYNVNYMQIKSPPDVLCNDHPK